MSETLDDDVYGMYMSDEDDGTSFGEFELGDGVELSILSADKEGHLKFEFIKMIGNACGRIRQPFVMSEAAWRSFAEAAREIDMCLLAGETRKFQLSPDTGLITCFTDAGDRYARLLLSEKTGRIKKFDVTYAAWLYLADMLIDITREADALRRY
jgi:hypothetical protein